MKKTFQIILVAVGFTAFLASCQCKTCKRAGDPSIQVCRGDGTEQEYNDRIDFLVATNYDCK